MKALFCIAVFVSVNAAAPAQEPQAPHRRGDHPAVIVKRLEAQKTYDYTAQFYPHPAWLWLAAEPPRPMMDHPAVIIAKRLKQEAAAAKANPSPVTAVISSVAGGE
jgi:hypothetical protein